MNIQLIVNVVIQAMVTAGALCLVHKPPLSKSERIGIYLIFWAFVVYAVWNNYLLSGADVLMVWILPIALGIIGTVVLECKK